MFQTKRFVKLWLIRDGTSVAWSVALFRTSRKSPTSTPWRTLSVASFLVTITPFRQCPRPLAGVCIYLVNLLMFQASRQLWFSQNHLLRTLRQPIFLNAATACALENQWVISCLPHIKHVAVYSVGPSSIVPGSNIFYLFLSTRCGGCTAIQPTT